MNNEKEREGSQGEETHDIFEDPTVSRTLAEDPVMKVLVRWWQQVLVALIVIVIVIYAKHKFTATYNARLGEASDVFAKVSGEFSRVEDLDRQVEQAESELAKAGQDEKKKEESQKKLEVAKTNRADTERRFQEVLASLSDTRPPYSQTDQFYRLLSSHRSGNVQAVKDAISDPTAWKSVDAKDLSGRFISELKCLTYARSLLDSGEQSGEGKDLLAELGESGIFVRVPAALTFARVAEGIGERTRALALLQSLVSAEPEQSDLVKDEISRLQA